MMKTMERNAAEVVVRPNTFATILVHAEPRLAAASHRVEAAARLARDLDARLIGVGAETFNPGPYSGAFLGYAGAEWVALVQEQIAKNIAAAETAFRRDAAGADIDWRTAQDYPHRALVNAAHAADLIVVSPRNERGDLQSANPADVVMSAGRPVLVVPEGRSHLVGLNVVVAWKNTRECRRALGDAMPFLQRADQVVVVAVVKPDMADVAARETGEVVANLKRHGVDARPLVTSIGPDPVELEIERIAGLNGADLIVAGAYGHGRLREWAFGGVTDSFLHRPPCFVLLSH
ncbi:universal stress protein [Phenylobacterium sp.]|uniref:universal stress protein n=1 Tax=Phenylobacterium sp. TaxID=1871053 RepID=UPI0025E3607D|nr:universal stress protein [Phenylobacterium sp.]MBX3485850.1 universal stress protein [Phenylobacterium sp.]